MSAALFGITQGLGQAGSDTGEAAGALQQLQDQRAKALSDIARQQAESQYQLGSLALQQKQFEAGKYYIDPRTPYLQNPDGSYSLVEYNRLGGAPRVTKMPDGFIAPDSPAAIARQLRQAIPGITDDQVQTIVAAHLGYRPYIGLSEATGVDPKIGR